jgi:hypothetical protein
VRTRNPKPFVYANSRLPTLFARHSSRARYYKPEGPRAGDELTWLFPTRERERQRLFAWPLGGGTLADRVRRAGELGAAVGCPGLLLCDREHLLQVPRYTARDAQEDPLACGCSGRGAVRHPDEHGAGPRFAGPDGELPRTARVPDEPGAPT